MNSKKLKNVVKYLINKVNKIIIVGGGTSGCISALMLNKQFPHIQISIIESSDIGIVGVGESSTEHWSHFCDFIGVNLLDALIHCNATFKSGVYFENWAEEDFMHNIDPLYAKTYGTYYGVYAYLISQGKKSYNPLSVKNILGTDYFNDLNDSPYYQFQFDTFLLNEYLHNICTERGIEIIYDNLIGANFHENEDLKNVISEDNTYEADFFIDCSGFARLLLNQVYQIPWVSYSEYLPLNSAISFATDEMEEYNKYTKSTARNAGWSWTIPTQSKTGNGYVYCDQFIDRDEAHREMEEAYGQSLNISKEFKFDPGRLEKAWHKNCYAVGLSQSFVEPLEATSIGSSIQQMFCFISYFPSYDYETCNEDVNEMFDNIVDYVQAHYLTKREDTLFWKEIKYNLNLTPRLKSYLKMWKNRLPITTDIKSSWGLFHTANYIPILHGLGWFDVDKIKEQYEKYYRGVIEYDIENSIKGEILPPFVISHKKFIKEIINARQS
jgi:tryptophan 6-halogenase